MRYQVRRASIDDVEAYVRCHVACMAETYASLMPAAFTEQQRLAIPGRIEQTRESWEAGSQPGRTTLWLGSDGDGSVVGVARSGPGPQDWETDLGAPLTAVAFQLHHLYTLSRTHGSGLGQSLLEAAVGDRDSYLWILHGNARAEAFYRRNGFRPDGAEIDCGPSWFSRPMFRMVRARRLLT